MRLEMDVIIRVDLKIVHVFYSREVLIEKVTPVPSYRVISVDEERYERITSHIAQKFENKERWFDNLEDAKAYANTLLYEYKKKILRMLQRNDIPETAVKVYI